MCISTIEHLNLCIKQLSNIELVFFSVFCLSSKASSSSFICNLTVSALNHKSTLYNRIWHIPLDEECCICDGVWSTEIQLRIWGWFINIKSDLLNIITIIPVISPFVSIQHNLTTIVDIIKQILKKVLIIYIIEKP